MGKNLLLSRANIRKAKGQTITIAALVLLASIMMNLWLMLVTDYKRNFERSHDSLNDGHVTLSAYYNSGDFTEFIEKLLSGRSDVTEFCITDTVGWSGTFEYNGGEINAAFVFLDKQTALSRNVGKVEITEESEYTSGIYLPVLYGTYYSAGDEIELTVGSETLKYTVCGFFNSVMAGSHNCAICSMVLTEDKYDELAEAGIVPRSTLISLRLNDKMKCSDVETELKNEILGEYAGTVLISNTYELVSLSRYISQSICAAILSAMAFLITLIAAVVISSNVMNYIHEDMRKLGALKAIGYISGQLISVLITQFSGVSLVTAAVGIALSYSIFPALNDMMISQTGIPYTVKFLPVPCAITLAVMVGATAISVFFSAKRIHKIEPITALRQGIQTHNFRKNHIPLDKASSPLILALSLKNVFSEMKRNVTVCVTMAALSLMLVFSGVILDNFIMDKQGFINIVAGVTADSCINVYPTSEEQLKTALENDSRVVNFYLFTTESNITHADGASLMVNVCDDCSKIGNPDVIVEGRFPKYDNEIAIAIKYARETGLKVGDEISLTMGANKEKYIISGYTQLSDNLGKDCLLTRGGYERIGEFTDLSYYIDVIDGTDIDKFNEEITEPFSNEVNTLLNIYAILEGSGSVYMALVTMIVTAVLILGGIIVLFVMYLLVRTMLNNKRRDYGILKSLGFTAKQLVLQTALSFMPPVIISTVIGITLSAFVINPLMALFLGVIGIVKCTFNVPLYFNLIAGIVLNLFAFGAACLLSLRVRKIAPRELLSGE